MKEQSKNVRYVWLEEGEERIEDQPVCASKIKFCPARCPTFDQKKEEYPDATVALLLVVLLVLLALLSYRRVLVLMLEGWRWCCWCCWCCQRWCCWCCW
jgi:hypothetical protein